MAAGCVIALTGGIGSGKSTVADMFAQRAVPVVDTDVIAHSLTGPDGPALRPIVDLFGPGFRTSLGALDREAMRVHVFGDDRAKRALESILHPMIRSEVDAALLDSSKEGPYTLLVVPLLFESTAYRQRAVKVLAVDCPTALQVERVMQRSALAPEQIQRIMLAQVSRACRLQMADDVICNAGGRGLLEPQVEHLHQRYVRTSAASP
jgi:dephospho-CoA kinase